MPDWYRRSTWTEDDRKDFEARLRRARAHSRAQYVRIQAVHLAKAGLHEHAVALFQRALDEDPDPTQIAPALCGLGRSLLAVERRPEALDVMRRCIAREREFPSVQVNGWLDFAFTVARAGLTGCFAEARFLVDDARAAGVELVFPVDRFRLHATNALLATDPGIARDEAKRALDEADRTTSGLAYHAVLGLVEDQHDSLRAQLTELLGR